MKTFEFLFVWWWFFSKETVNCSWSDKELLAVMYVYILMKISRNLMKKHFRIFTNIFKYKNSLIFFKNIKQILNSDWMRNLKLLLNIWNTQTYTVHQISSAAVWTVLEQIIFTSWHISVGMYYSTTPQCFPCSLFGHTSAVRSLHSLMGPCSGCVFIGFSCSVLPFLALLLIGWRV